MADWYVGSVQYAAVAQWAASHAYSVGDIVRQLATPSVGNERCFRCTTAGTSGASEPAWTLTQGGNTTSGTAVFKEVTGNATYNWSAPYANLKRALQNGVPTSGDRVFVAHNHAFSTTGTYSVSGTDGSETFPVRVYCVNASGSVPPVSADLRTTATETSTGEIDLWNGVTGCAYFYGLGWSGANFRVGPAGGNQTELVFDSCNFTFTGGSFMLIGSNGGNSNISRVEFINTPVIFSAVGQSIYPNGKFIWRNTASAIGAGTVPTHLFDHSNGTFSIGAVDVTLDGLDLNALNTALFMFPADNGFVNFKAFNCKLNASVTVSNSPSKRCQEAHIFACDSAGNSARNEKYCSDGTMTTETTIVRSSGASDGTTPVSWKAVTSGDPNKAFQLELPPIAVWNSATGSSKTATIEIVNDGTTLNSDDIWVEVEYLGASGSPLASIVSSRPADHLTTGSALTTSSVTWTTTGLASPVKQKLSVSFTPQMAGLVRAKVCIAKASKTIYVDPMVTIS